MLRLQNSEHDGLLVELVLDEYGFVISGRGTILVFYI